MSAPPTRHRTAPARRYAPRRFARLTAALALWLNAAHAETTLREDIPPQSLPTALRAFIGQTSLQIVYESALADAKQSPGAKHGEADTEALRHLLAGTGLTFERVNQRTLRLVTAQTVAATSPSAVRSASRAAVPAIEEIIVTAQERREPLHSVPISASVLTDAELANSDLSDVESMMAVVPGANYNTSSQWGSGIYKHLSIRGIRSDKNQTTTSLYLDDTPIDMPGTSFTDVYPVAFDLERVEVLRGPQGVLFGQAAEGGAVRFISHPASTRDGEARYHLEAASTARGGGALEGSAVVGGPLIPGTLGVRVGAWYRDDGGYVDRVDPFTGVLVEPNVNRTHRRALRLAAVYEPTDAVRVAPTFYYLTQHAHDAATFFAGLSNASEGEFRSGRLLRQPSDDTFTVGSMRAEIGLHAVNVTAIASYVDRHARARVDLTNEAGVFIGGYGDPRGPAYPVSYADAVSHPLGLTQTQATGELRVASAGSGPLTWVGGMFLSRQTSHSDAADYTVAVPSVPALYSTDRDQGVEEALFGSLNYRFASYWTVGAGVRVGRAHDRFQTQNGGYFDSAGDVVSAGDNHSNNPPVGRADLSFAPTPELFVYASAAKGARRGGGDPSTAVSCGGTPTPSTFRADSLWSYELGLKSQLVDHRLRLDVSAYDIQWDNAQINVYDACGNRYMLNASTIVSRGAELEIEGLVGDGLRLKAAVEYNDVHLEHDAYGAAGVLLARAGSVTGGLPAVAAPWSGELVATYSRPLSATSEGFVRAEFIAHSHNPGPFAELSPASPFYNPSVSSDPATELTNLRSGVRHGNLEVTAFVNNVFDTHPALQLNNDQPGSSLVYAYTLRPRTVGVAMTLQY